MNYPRTVSYIRHTIFMVIACFSSNVQGFFSLTYATHQPQIFSQDQRTIAKLHEELARCEQRRKQLLMSRDSHGYLSRMNILQSKLDALEQQAEVAHVKKKFEKQLAQESHHKAQAHLKSLDERVHAFKKVHHKEISATERHIAQLAQKLYNSLSPAEQKELQRLIKERESLKANLPPAHPKNIEGQKSIFDLLFI